MKKLLFFFLILLTCVKAGASVPITQTFEEVTPGQYIYERQDDEILLPTQKFFTFPKTAVIVGKRTESWGVYPRRVEYLDSNSTLDWFTSFFQKGDVSWEVFIIYYKQMEE